MKSELLFHKPVLVSELLEWLDPQPGGLYVDVTFGSGGHTRAILQAQPTCKVIAMDWDRTSLDTYAPYVEADFPDRFSYVWGNFARVHELLKKKKITQVNGVLADFGTSQMQIMEREGFSFSIDTPLDMRMSPAHQKTTAELVVNYATESELRTLLWDYGQERHAKRIAREIVHARKKQKLTTTGQLAQLIVDLLGRKKGAIHPATKTFQAIRIYVNRELENIRSFLLQAVPLLFPGGRLVCISFHSLEDRLVKQFFQEQAQQGTLEILTKKPVVGTEQEIAENPSARSAKLRAAERLR